MKKISILVILMMSVVANAQLRRATITLRDGTVKKGKAKIRNVDMDVKFIAKKGAEKEYFNFRSIKSITIAGDDRMINYEMRYKTKKVDSKGNIINTFEDGSDDWKKDDVYQIYIQSRTPFLFEVIVKGKVSLYAILNNQNVMLMGGNNMMMGVRAKSTAYYLSKGNDDYVTLVRSSFKKKAIKYFSDCPDLVQKIKKEVFRKRDIKEVVEYYNSNCGE